MDDPLYVERKNLMKAKKDLDAYLKKRADTKKKITPQEEAMKSSLQNKLLEQKIKYKEEEKKAQRVKREIQKQEMKEAGGDAHKNIILPQYVKNEELQVYEEVNMPPKSMYKAIGYNDMQRVKVVMEGDDAEKRSENIKRESKILQRTSTVAR